MVLETLPLVAAVAIAIFLCWFSGCGWFGRPSGRRWGSWSSWPCCTWSLELARGRCCRSCGIPSPFLEQVWQVIVAWFRAFFP